MLILRNIYQFPMDVWLLAARGAPLGQSERLLAGEDVETIPHPICTLPAGLYQQSRKDLAKWLSGFSFLITIVH